MAEYGTDKETVATYNKAAEAYKDRYTAMGARVEDVDRGFSFCETDTPFVVEVGPGNGREAAVIVSRSGKYLGIDISDAMVQLARDRLPDVEFVVGDIATYALTSDVDIIFAFASLLHLSRDAMTLVLDKCVNSLRPGGVLYISLKRRQRYCDEVKVDSHGPRHFYYYSKRDILAIKPNTLECIHYDEQRHADEDWFTIVFKKQSV